MSLAAAMPPIGGVAFLARPSTLDEIATQLLDAQEAGDPEAVIAVLRTINEPEEELADYRFRMAKVRKGMVRERAETLVSDVDNLLGVLTAKVARDSTKLADDEQWQQIVASVAEIQRLLAGELVPTGDWGTLFRHLRFGLGVDLHDIADSDWPSVRRDIEAALYSELEPLPIAVDDLATLAASRPQGTVTAALDWSAIDGDGFERLIFNLLTDARGYENTRRHMGTNAPDRGRDISTERVVVDPIAGTRRLRIIVQCKHWQSKSVNLAEVTTIINSVSLWEPPPVDALMIATSGNFTADAVRFIERHTEERRQPVIEMLGSDALEAQLAKRGDLVTEYGLRRRA